MSRVTMIAIAIALCSAWSLHADDVTSPEVSSIAAAWRLRSQTSPKLRIEWRHPRPRRADRFARAEREWITANGGDVGDQTATELQLDGDRLLFSGWRTAVRPHGYDPAQVTALTATVGVAHPERIGAPYLRALLGHFADKDAEQRPVQRFHRSYDGTVFQDYWEATDDAYPRATLHDIPARGSTDWSTLRFEAESDEQLQTLELMAALLGVRPDHPLLGIDAGSLRMLPKAAVIDGAACVVLEDATESAAGASQRLFVDRERGWVVRRYIGTAGGEGVQIDLQYARDIPGPSTPAGWTVMRFAAADRPVQVYARSEVIKMGDGVALDESQLQFVHPAGTWVVDHRKNESCLLKSGGERRIVTEAELRWLPTYEELVQTRSGGAGVLIEERVARSERWGQMQWPLAAGGALLAIAVVVKWRSGRPLREHVAVPARADEATDELAGSESALRS